MSDIVLVGMAATLLACGGQSAPETTTERPQGRDIEALITKLTAAAPQGSITPQQAATTADRQEQIVRDYAAEVSEARCKASLQRLAASYSGFSRAARTTDPADEAYSAAAQQVTITLEDVERSC